MKRYWFMYWEWYTWTTFRTTTHSTAEPSTKSNTCIKHRAPHCHILIHIQMHKQIEVTKNHLHQKHFYLHFRLIAVPVLYRKYQQFFCFFWFFFWLDKLFHSLSCTRFMIAWARHKHDYTWRKKMESNKAIERKELMKRQQKNGRLKEKWMKMPKNKNNKHAREKIWYFYPNSIYIGKIAGRMGITHSMYVCDGHDTCCIQIFALNFRWHTHTHIHVDRLSTFLSVQVPVIAPAGASISTNHHKKLNSK